MRKRMLTILVIASALLIFTAGCKGKDASSASGPADITSIPVSEISVDRPGNAGEDHSASVDEAEIKNDGENAENKNDENADAGSLSEEEVKNILEAFLEGDVKCHYRSDVELDYTDNYDLNELIAFEKRSRFGAGSDEYHAGSALYGFIDCGCDGIPELVLAIEYEIENPDEYDEGAEVYFFLRVSEDNTLEIFNVEESFYRTGVSIYDSGYIAIGGSSGASTYDNSYYILSAAGEKVFLCSMTDSFVPFEPFIQETDISEAARPDDYPVYSGAGERYLFPDELVGFDYLVRRINFIDYRAFMLDDNNNHPAYADYNKFFVGNSDGEDVNIPASYMKYYTDMGLEVHNLSESIRYIREHVAEIGFDLKVTEGDAVYWNILSLG